MASKKKATSKSATSQGLQAKIRRAEDQQAGGSPRTVTGGLATAANLASVSGLSLKDAVHHLMRLGKLDWTVYPIRRGQRITFFSEG
jgi:hypothetical protein